MDTTAHVKRLKSIAQAELPVKPATENHRYYWLEAGHTPEPLKDSNTKPPQQLSDYQNACKSASQFWSSPALVSDRELVRICRAMNKRDTLAKIWVEEGKTKLSEYQAATELTAEKVQAIQGMDRSHHLRSNPITEIAQAFVMQKQLMRK